MDAMDDIQEMNDAFGDPLNEMMDDDELEAELAELEELDELENDLMMNAMPVETNMGAPVSVQQMAEDDELAELEAMMNVDYVPTQKNEEMKEDIAKKKELDIVSKQTFEAYNDSQIKVTVEYEKVSGKSGVYDVVMTFCNQTSNDIEEFDLLIIKSDDLEIEMTLGIDAVLLSKRGQTTVKFRLITTKSVDNSLEFEIEMKYLENCKQTTKRVMIKLPLQSLIGNEDQEALFSLDGGL